MTKLNSEDRDVLLKALAEISRDDTRGRLAMDFARVIAKAMSTREIQTETRHVVIARCWELAQQSPEARSHYGGKKYLFVEDLAKTTGIGQRIIWDHVGDGDWDDGSAGALSMPEHCIG